MNKKIIIPTIMILLMISLASAVSHWEQYVPSPTVDNIEKVRTTGYYAMALTTTDKVLFYNGLNWAEIIHTSVADELISFDVASNDKFYFYSKNTTTNGFFIQEYNPETQTWSTVDNGLGGIWDLGTSPYYSFACIKDGVGLTGGVNDAECYIVGQNGTDTLKAIETVNAIAITKNSSQNTATSTAWIKAETNVYITSASVNCGAPNGCPNIHEWNGASWVNREGTSGTGMYYFGFSEYDTSTRVITMDNPSGSGGSEGVYFYNITTGTTNPKAFASRGYRAVDIQPNTQTIYYTIGDGASVDDDIYSSEYDDTSATLDTDTIQNMYDLDFDKETGVGWAVGGNGVIYSYNGSAITESSQLYITFEHNPVVRGTGTKIYFTPTYSSGESSTIYVNISNKTGNLEYTFQLNNVPSGYRAEAEIDDVAWLNFEADTNYSVYAKSVGQSTSATLTDNETWQISNSTLINVTTYNLSEYKTTLNNTYNIISIDASSNDISYAIAENDTNLLIISIDHSNPLNLLTQHIAVTKSTTFMNKLTSIQSLNDYLYIGTNDELYIYNGSQEGDATQIIQERTISMTGRDYITDVAEINDTYTWICQNDYLTDRARMYNDTTLTFNQQINENPCLAIIWEEQNDLLIIHQGTNGIEIYNQSNRTKFSTITGINTQPDNVMTDRLSTYNDILYAITGTNIITKYNISNPSSPQLVDECRTDREITSLEAINENEVIIGSTNQIKVCDFNNNATYYSEDQYYIAENLQGLLSGETITEITLNEETDDYSKISIALGNQIGVYIYSKTITETLTQTAPVFTNIEISDTTPCINQVIQIEITALDNEGDSISYDWGCDSIIKPTMTNNYLYDSFECFYNEIGFKNIIIFATDGYTTPTVTTRTVTIQNCTAQDQLLLKYLDSSTGQEVAGVYVELSDGQTGTTNTNGNVDFNVTTNDTMQATHTRDGYFSETIDVYPTSNRALIYINPLTDSTGATITSLTVITQNEAGTRINGTLVSVTNTITGENKYGFTDINGQVILTNMFTGAKLLITAQNEEQNYATTTTRTSLVNGQQKTITINMGTEDREGRFTTTDRNCQDLIPSVLLCGNLTTTGIGNNCTLDAQCISGDCRIGISGSDGECARFNWTLCDDQNLGRTNGCFISQTIYGGFRAYTGTILKYFLYVLVFIATMMIAVVIRKRKDER